MSSCSRWAAEPVAQHHNTQPGCAPQRPAPCQKRPEAAFFISTRTTFLADAIKKGASGASCACAGGTFYLKTWLVHQDGFGFAFDRPKTPQPLVGEAAWLCGFSAQSSGCAVEHSGQRTRACAGLSACTARVWAGPRWTRAPQVAPRSAALRRETPDPPGRLSLRHFCLAGQKKCLARRGASRPPPLAKRASFATASSFPHKASDLHKSGICSPLPTVALAFSRRKNGQIQKPFLLRKRFLCQRRLSPSPPSSAGEGAKPAAAAPVSAIDRTLELEPGSGSDPERAPPWLRLPLRTGCMARGPCRIHSAPLSPAPTSPAGWLAAAAPGASTS